MDNETASVSENYASSDSLPNGLESNFNQDSSNTGLLKILSIAVILLVIMILAAVGIAFLLRPYMFGQANPTPTPEPTLVPSPSSVMPTTTPPVSPTNNPSSAPTPKVTFSSESESKEIILQENPDDSSKLDVYLVKPETEDEYFTTIDAFTSEENPHIEINNNALYANYRVGYDGYPDENWIDELRAYQPGQEPITIYSIQGLNYKIAPDGKHAAIAGDAGERLVIIDLETNQTLATYTPNDFAARNENGHQTFTINLRDWSSSSQSFWVDLSFTMYARAFVEITLVPDPTVTEPVSFVEYDLSGISAGAGLILNPDSSKLTYDDFPTFFDIDSYEDFMANENTINLYIYDLLTGTETILETATNHQFNPKWLSDNQIEYLVPGSEAETTSIILDD